MCTSNVVWSNKTKWLYTKKNGKKQSIPAETMTDADYADDLALSANTSAQPESQLHSLVPIAGTIGLSVKANKYPVF